MSLLVPLPVLVPLATLVGCLLAWRRVRAQRALSALGAAGLFAASMALLARIVGSGPEAVQLGAWPAPHGITFVADTFAAIMVALNGVVALAGVFYALGAIDRRRERHGFHPLLHALFAAISGAFLTGDIFNLYVWFEVMLMASFVLLALGGRRAQLEGALKYVTLNLLSSVIFLAAIGALYGAVGSLNMADLAVRIPQSDRPALLTGIGVLFLAAFGIKAAVFPAFFWLPASYHTPPPVVSAIFAGLLTKVGVYSLVRVFTLVFAHEPHFTHAFIVWIAGFTMASGVLGAAVQGEIRRILAFHSVSQVGYMLMGLGVAGVALVRSSAARAAGDPIAAEAMHGAAVVSLVGVVFYIVHHGIVKMNLFLVSGVVERVRGTGELARAGGLYHARPLLAMLFMVSAMSLAGMPLLSGFWSKLALVRGGLQAETYGIVAVSLAVSLLTLFSMTKIWAAVFWSPPPDHDGEEPTERPGREHNPRGFGLRMAAIVFLAASTVAIGLGAGPAYRLAERASLELLDPSVYIGAVLGAEAGAASRGVAGLEAGARRQPVDARDDAAAESAEPQGGAP